MAVQAQYPANLVAGDGEANPKWRSWAQMNAPRPPATPPTQVTSLAELHTNPDIGLFHCQTSSRSTASSTSSVLSEGIREIDCFLQSQVDELRRAVSGHRRRQYKDLLELADGKLREKEAEMKAAAQTGAELERQAAELSAAAEAWRSRARAQEAAAAALEAQLRRAEAGEKAEMGDAASSTSEATRLPVCKRCRRRAACVVTLPCRHLGLCAECDSVERVCPSCHSFMSGSVRVYFS